MKHLLKIIMVMALTGFMSGCSELEEIEERGFVVGAAYDIVKEKKANPIMKGTYQMVLPSKLSQQGGQGVGIAKIILMLVQKQIVYLNK